MSRDSARRSLAPAGRACALLLGALLLLPSARAHSPHDVIDAWAISPDFAHDRTLFVTMGRFNVLLRSRDAGATFEVVNTGLDTAEVRGLAISPDFAHDRTLFCTEPTRAYVTHDAGDHWERLPVPAKARLLRMVAVSPDFAQDGIVLLGTGRDGLWLSRDRGATWTCVVKPGAAGEPGVGSVQAIRFSPDFAQDQRVFALVEGRRLVLSTDAGASFADLPAPDARVLQALEYDTARGTLWVGSMQGVRRSDDDGATWHADNPPDLVSDVQHLTLARDARGVGVLFASTATDGVWIRDPDGTWRANPEGFRPQTEQSTRHYYGTFASPAFADDHTVYAATFEGLYVSSTAGDGWRWLDVLPPCIVRNLTLSPRFAQDGTLWLSTYGLGLVEGRAPDSGLPPHGPSTPSELTLGEGSGLHWTRLNTLGWMFPDGIALSPEFHEDGTMMVGTPNRLVLSTDWGATGQAKLPLKHSFARALVFAPDFAQSGLAFAHVAAFVGTSPTTYHYARSTDRGATWTELSDLAADDMAFASDWVKSGRMYACGPEGLVRSDDRGLTYERLPLEADECGSLALAPALQDGDDPASARDTLLVCSRTSGLHLSRDAGESWSRLSEGLGVAIYDYVEISPDFARDGVAFAGPRTDGVFVTRDGGATWARTEGGPRVVLCMAISPTFAQDHTLLVGSFDGAWLSRDAGVTWARLEVPLPANYQPVFSR